MPNDEFDQSGCRGAPWPRAAVGTGVDAVIRAVRRP